MTTFAVLSSAEVVECLIPEHNSFPASTLRWLIAWFEAIVIFSIAETPICKKNLTSIQYWCCSHFFQTCMKQYSYSRIYTSVTVPLYLKDNNCQQRIKMRPKLTPVSSHCEFLWSLFRYFCKPLFLSLYLTDFKISSCLICQRMADR